MLIGARAIQGIGAAAVMPLSLTLLAGAVPEKLRSAAIGIWGGISGLGIAVGPVVGGAVVDGLNWQWIFWLNVPIGAIAVVLAARVLTESRGAAKRLSRTLGDGTQAHATGRCTRRPPVEPPGKRVVRAARTAAE